MVKRSNNGEAKTDKVIVKTEKTASAVKFKLKEGLKPIRENSCTECSTVFIWCSNQRCSLALRKKDCKYSTFVTAEIKGRGKKVDRCMFKEPIFYCLCSAGDILEKDGKLSWSSLLFCSY